MTNQHISAAGRPRGDRREKTMTANGTCPVGGYDQLGKSCYCLDCGRQWYGDNPNCHERLCAFGQRT